MTIEQLMEWPAESLEKLSEKELIEFFTPFFTVTRPDPHKKKESTVHSAKDDPVIRRAKMIAAQFNLDLSALDGL